MEQNFSNPLFLERRTKHRINCDYPAIVQGRDRLKKNFAEKARVISLSSSGIFVVTNRSIQNNTEISNKNLHDFTEVS